MSHGGVPKTRHDDPGPAPTPRYPAELVADARLVDGTEVRVRPIGPDDEVALRAFHDSLSPSTVYLRFFSLHPHLSDREVDRFTHVDYHDRLALVVEEAGHMIGVGRFDRLVPTDDAEVAFVVADAHQHHGIGHLLLDHLVVAARARGVRRFVADTLAGNSAMLGVFLHSGFDVVVAENRGTVHVSFPITDDAAPITDDAAPITDDAATADDPGADREVGER